MSDPAWGLSYQEGERFVNIDHDTPLLLPAIEGQRL